MIVLIGESGCGKSLTEKELERRGFTRIISYTTRPMREREINGVCYHFISPEKFKELESDGFFAESVEYNGNFYGTAVEDCKDATVIVVEPDGLRQLKERADLNVKSFYLKAPELVRFQRMTVKRGDSRDAAHGRILKDRLIFKGISKQVDYVIDSNRTVDEIVTDILSKVY